MQQSALDLDRYHARQQHGDITAYLTWWLADDSGPRPCLVLFPTHANDRARPCVVLLDQAWRWSESIGDPRYAAALSMQFAKALGLDVNNHNNIFRVRGLIADHLGDLLAMPPMPDAMRYSVVLGEAKVKSREGGETIRHEEYIERV